MTTFDVMIAALLLIAVLAVVFLPASTVTVVPVSPQWSATLTWRGQIWCRGAYMADGLYTAGHCLEPGQRYGISGSRAISGLWSRDPWRDLGHIVGLGCAQVTLRRPELGETAERRGRGDAVPIVYMLTTHAQYERGGEVGDVTFDLWCPPDGNGPIPGDSGTGVYGADGALVGIVAAMSSSEYCLCDHCGETWVTGVP